MAATKTNIKIGEKKDMLARKINAINEQLRAQANKVPANVINGSHQLAVAWKEIAESVFARPLSGAPRRASVHLHEERLQIKSQMLNKLNGVGLL